MAGGTRGNASSGQAAYHGLLLAALSDEYGVAKPSLDDEC
jgi:hypothetical protein